MSLRSFPNSSVNFKPQSNPIFYGRFSNYLSTYIYPITYNSKSSCFQFYKLGFSVAFLFNMFFDSHIMCIPTLEGVLVLLSFSSSLVDMMPGIH